MKSDRHQGNALTGASIKISQCNGQMETRPIYCTIYTCVSTNNHDGISPTYIQCCNFEQTKLLTEKLFYKTELKEDIISYIHSKSLNKLLNQIRQSNYIRRGPQQQQSAGFSFQLIYNLGVLLKTPVCQTWSYLKLPPYTCTHFHSKTIEQPILCAHHRMAFKAAHVNKMIQEQPHKSLQNLFNIFT